MAPDTLPDKSLSQEQITDNSQEKDIVASRQEKNQQEGNDLDVPAKVEDDLEIYEDNAEADDLTDSEDEQVQPDRHVRITISTDHKRHANNQDKVEQGPRTATVTDVKFGMEDADDLRRKTTTPASAFTEVSDLKSADLRAGSLYSESRELVFRRAMTLMANRCMSRESTPLVSMNNPPYGVYGAKHFYLTQNRPAPMEPLKVWRGYHGSVYFEPIQVHTMPVAPGVSPTLSLEHCSSKLKNIISRSHMSSRLSQNKENGANNDWNGITRNTPSRTKSQLSTVSVHSIKGPRKMCILDRTSVLTMFNENTRDDIVWLKNQESTGTLRIFAQANNASQQNKQEKPKIMKGSVAHRLFEEKLYGASVTAEESLNQRRVPKMTKLPTKVPARPRKLFSPQLSSHVSAVRANTPDVDVNSSPHSDKLPPLDRGENNVT